MPKPKTVDYTKMRMNRTVEGRLIIKCDKCGRKGLYQEHAPRESKDQLGTYYKQCTVDHSEERTVEMGFDVIRNRDACWWKEDVEGVALRTLRRVRMFKFQEQAAVATQKAKEYQDLIEATK